MSEIWYDTREGSLLLGAAAVQSVIEQSAPGDVVPLGELLIAREFPFDKDSYTKADVEGWTRDDYIATGRLALRAIGQVQDDPYLMKKHMQRMYLLGIGPHEARYLNRPNSLFGSLTEFVVEAGSEVRSARHLFDDWTQQDFVAYAAELQAELGRVPTVDDHNAAMKRGRGPSYRVFRDRFGGVEPINHEAGFIRVIGWEDDDYIAWGVSVAKANPGRRLSQAMMSVLSARQLGPSDAVVRKRIGTIPRFAAIVQERIDQEQMQGQEKLKTYRDMAATGELPAEFAELPDDRLLRASARYLLVRKCVRDKSPQEIHKLSVRPDFLEVLERLDSGLTPGFVESTAVTMELFDDIWPPKEDVRRFRVTQRDISEYKKRRRRINR